MGVQSGCGRLALPAHPSHGKKELEFPDMSQLRESILELIVQTSTNLPPDVRNAMADAMASEQPGRSLHALNVIATNIDMATEKEGPICQDTGWLTFEVKTPVGLNQIELKQEIREAIARRLAEASFGLTLSIRCRERIAATTLVRVRRRFTLSSGSPMTSK
jgi:hypothetical protein